MGGLRRVAAVVAVGLFGTAAGCGGATSGHRALTTTTSLVPGQGPLAKLTCTLDATGYRGCDGLVRPHPGLAVRLSLDRPKVAAGGRLTATVTVTNTTGATVSLLDPHGCRPSFGVALTNAQVAPRSAITAVCVGRPLVLRPGVNRFTTPVATTYDACQGGSTTAPGGTIPLCLPGGGAPPLPPGRYWAVLMGAQLAFPFPAPAPVTLTGSRS